MLRVFHPPCISVAVKEQERLFMWSVQLLSCPGDAEQVTGYTQGCYLKYIDQEVGSPGLDDEIVIGLDCNL